MQICLTHDVDRVRKTWWHCLYFFIKTKKLYHIKSIFTRKMDKSYWNFETIMNIERRHRVRSTFFFLNETKKFEILKPSTFMLAYGRYRIDDPKIVQIIQELDSEGWEVGVHGSYDSYLQKDLMAKEKGVLEDIIGKKVIGIRQHHRNLDIPKTWQYQKEAGFQYDATFGSKSGVGFCDDKIRPFKPFNDDFTVIPLVIMDNKLIDSSKDIDEAWKRCEKLIDEAEKNDGVLTILWHNNRFDEKEYPGEAIIYEKIIEEGQRRGASIVRCCDLLNRS
jgi:peptidoglycan/xylan/chitin deacetylase (PgdA/CDA1 family)